MLRASLDGIKGLSAAMILTAAAGMVSVAAPVAADELRFELGLPDTSSFNGPLVRFVEKMKTAGVEAKVYNGSILGLAEVCTGMRDGLVDGGLCLFPYNPAEFAEANLMATLSMFATSGSASDHPAAAMTGAMMEYIFFKCPECLDQIKAQNHVYLGSSSTPAYDLLCRGDKQIRTLADFAGKRIRSGGSNFTRIAEYFGATGVSMKGAEVFDGLDKGVLDCIMIAASELITLRLVEVTDFAMLGWPGGVYVGQNFPGMNRESWQRLTAEQRVFALKALAEMAADGVFSFDVGNEAGLKAGREKGMTMVESPPEVRDKVNEFLAGDLEAIKAEFTNQYGLKDVDQKLVQAQELIEKWKGLTNGALTEAQLAGIYWAEVFSKLDAVGYAMD